VPSARDVFEKDALHRVLGGVGEDAVELRLHELRHRSDPAVNAPGPGIRPIDDVDTSGTDAYAGLHGSGTLTGDGRETSVLDVYTGKMHID
jgi:hypothetical protein